MKRLMILAFAASVAFSASSQSAYKKALNRLQQQTSAQINQQLRQANYYNLNNMYEIQRIRQDTQELQDNLESLRRQRKQAELWQKQSEMWKGINQQYTHIGQGQQPCWYEFKTPEENFSSLCQMGIYYYKINDTNRALMNLDQAINMSKRIVLRGREDDCLSARYYRGVLNDARGDTAGTIEDFEEVARLGDVNHEYVQYAIQRLMGIYYSQGDYDNVVKKHRLLTTSRPEVQDNRDYQLFMAQTQLIRRAVGDACDHLDRAMDYDMDTALLCALYYCDSNLGILDSSNVTQIVTCLAERLADKDIILTEDVLNFALEILGLSCQFDKLLVLCEKQKSFYADYPPFLYYQAFAYLYNDELSKAIETYIRLSDLFKYDSFSYGNNYPIIIDTSGMEELGRYVQLAKASLLIKHGDYLESYNILKELPESFDVNMSDDLLCYAAFFNYAMGGDYMRAIKQYNIIIKSEPSADIYLSRGYCYYKIAYTNAAKQDFEQVLLLESDSATWNTPAAFYYLGNDSMAKKAARQLMSKDTLSSEDYYNASWFYDAIGKERKAFRLLKKAFKLEHDKIREPLWVLSYENLNFRAKVEKYISQH